MSDYCSWGNHYSEYFECVEWNVERVKNRDAAERERRIRRVTWRS
jgi:hypothetical protein